MAADGPETDVASLPGTAPAIDLPRAVRLLTGLAWFSWALLWLQGSGQSAIAPVIGTFALLGGVVIIGISLASWPAERWRKVDVLILTGTLVIVGLWLGVNASAHTYGNDELTTGQASAVVLLQGHNPYGADLTPTLNALNLPTQTATPIFGGGIVHTTSYPALSFLVYVPFGAVLGTGSPFALLADGIAFLALMVLLRRLLDERLRIVVPLIASAFLLVGFVDSGVTDSLFLPFLCVALYRWDRFVVPGEPAITRWLGPVCLGVACSVKPLPWLVGSFLVAAVALEAARRGGSPLRSAAKYAAAVLAVFLVINGPFIALDPGAWVHGALLPLVQPLIPSGQGIVQLPLYMHIAGGHVSYLTPAGLGAIVASLGLFVAGYPRTRLLLPLMAVAPLLLSSRSLVNYFADLVILLLVHASSIRRDEGVGVHGHPRVRLAGRGLAVAGGVVAAAASAAFLLSPAPLQLSIAGTHRAVDTAGNITVSLDVVAVNLTDQPIHPTFAVTFNGYLNPGWRPSAGSEVLPPHARETYRLVPTDPRTTIDKNAVFRVDALATDPSSISTSEWATAP